MSDYDSENAEWYYLKGGRQLGPVPERSIRAWLESGFLEATDLLWRSGLEQWTEVRAIEELGGAGVSVGGPPRVHSAGPDRSTGSTVDHTIDEAAPPDLSRGGDERSGVSPGTTTSSPSEQTSGYGSAIYPGATTARAQETTRFASIWVRLGAFFIDDLIVNALVSPLLLFRLKPGVAVDVWQPDPVVAIAFVVVYLLYGAACESSTWQATLGKRAWRIRVTGLDGHRVSITQAMVRQMGKIVSALGFGLGFLMAAVSPRKQALHDWLSGCLVVKE